MKHTEADIDARNSPLGRIVGGTAVLGFVALIALIAYAVIFPPACTRVDVWQFSVCL